MTDFNPPTTSLFNYQSLGSGTTLAVNYDSAKGYSLARSDAGSGGDHGAFQGKAVAAGASWTAKMKFKLFSMASGDIIRSGMALFESGTGKVLSIGLTYASGTTYIQVITSSTLNGFGSNLYSQAFIGRPPDYFAISLSGSNYILKASFDGGVTFTTIFTEAITSAFTTAADKIGFWLENNGTFTGSLNSGVLIDYYNDPDF